MLRSLLLHCAVASCKQTCHPIERLAQPHSTPIMNAVSRHLRLSHGRALLMGRLLRHTARRRLCAGVSQAQGSGVLGSSCVKAHAGGTWQQHRRSVLLPTAFHKDRFLRINATVISGSGASSGCCTLRIMATCLGHFGNSLAYRQPLARRASAGVECGPGNSCDTAMCCAVATREEGEAVLLDVGGMKCGGCSAAVKRILSSRPEVTGLSVNLLTESAAVRVRRPEAAAGAATDGAELARQLAGALTAKVGFHIQKATAMWPSTPVTLYWTYRRAVRLLQR